MLAVKGFMKPQKKHKDLSLSFCQVACGYAHALALSDSGIVYGWGANSYGQLGSGNKANVVNPIQVLCFDLCTICSSYIKLLPLSLVLIVI